jgi:hypothetical protein
MSFPRRQTLTPESLAARRRNARKSTGQRSPRGKAQVALNAFIKAPGRDREEAGSANRRVCGSGLLSKLMILLAACGPKVTVKERNWNLLCLQRSKTRGSILASREQNRLLGTKLECPLFTIRNARLHSFRDVGFVRQRRNETGMSFRIRAANGNPFFVPYFRGTKLECLLESVRARGTNPNTKPDNGRTKPNQEQCRVTTE